MRNLTPTQQYKINSLGIPELHFKKEFARIYPYKNLVSHTVGFAGIDNKGLSGIEHYFDDRLRNNPDPLKLSIDVRLQYIVKSSLQKAMKEFKAIGATGIIVHIPSGEIMAMASLPDFNPHKPINSKNLFNSASMGLYEMGSVFKSFTFASAFNQNIINFTDGFDTTEPIKIANFTIKDFHPQKRYLSIPEIFAYSSNIGTAKIAMEIGMAKQQNFLKKLGMMDKLDIELSELATPILPKKWRDINMLTISYGHGISVTPLHIISAISTIVNGGYAQKLTLIKDKNQGSAIGKRVISTNSSRKIRRLLRLVVQYGTGRKAEANGYRVGGKTGTAEKPSKGKYNKNALISSFVGAFPIDNPEYAIFIMLDEPKGNAKTYGYATAGWVAAPIVSEIINKMAPMFGITPIYTEINDSMDKYWQALINHKKSGDKNRLYRASF